MHGERRGLLEQEENEGSLMAVAIDCKSKSQFLLRPPPVMHLARRPPSPPPIRTIRHSPPPSPSPPPDLEYLYEAAHDDSRIVANEAITISSRSIRPAASSAPPPIDGLDVLLGFHSNGGRKMPPPPPISPSDKVKKQILAEAFRKSLARSVLFIIAGGLPSLVIGGCYPCVEVK